IWDKPFLSGESNMAHSIANLEAHHFKYGAFRRPGDVHVHFFGTATLSFGNGVTTRAGDVFEIAAEPFRWPLRNPLAIAADAPVGHHEGVAGVPHDPGIGWLCAAHPEVAAVALCTPPQQRHALARAALARGLHVLLEKPPGATVAEVADLIACAQRAGRTLFA